MALLGLYKSLNSCYTSEAASGPSYPYGGKNGGIMDRHEQLDVVKSIRINESDNVTIDCPFCGGRKKFTITKQNGTLLWNCYRASCTASGAYRAGFKYGEIKQRMNTGSITGKKTRPLPEMLSNPDHHDFVTKYIRDNNCMAAYESGAVDIRYAPKDNRCLFMMNDGTGAVGRHMGTRLPKWMSYGDTTGILAVGNKPTAVVVEDAASACSIYATNKYTGVALLGTNVSSKQRILLRRYKSVIICLDNDAKKKSILALSRIQGMVPTTVRFLPKDPKYYEKEELIERLEENESAWNSRNRL